MGGQTGLNIAKTLAESGILEKHGVELIGAKLESIDRAEDRDLFKKVWIMANTNSQRYRTSIHHSIYNDRDSLLPAINCSLLLH